MKLIGCEYTCNCSVSQVLFAFYFERKVRPDFRRLAERTSCAWLRSAENGDTEVLRLDSDRSTRTYSCGVFEQCGPVRFHKDGERVYFLTNKGSDVDLVRLESFNPATGKEELVGWIVNETARTPQGEIIDVSTIEKGSLLFEARVH